jgi:orotate phosphoribosyltransferase
VSAQAELARRVYDTAHVVGSFRLRSGAVSDQYFDKYRFESDPDLLFEVTAALKPMIPADIELLAGLELGGIPIATVLSQMTKLPVIFVRKRVKDFVYGVLCRVENVASKATSRSVRHKTGYGIAPLG